jgi:hypothetical protein
MTDRETILSQIKQSFYLSSTLNKDLTRLEIGITTHEPMAFDMGALHSIRVLAAALENLAITCNHTLERQRNEAFNKSNAALDARKTARKPRNA